MCLGPSQRKRYAVDLLDCLVKLHCYFLRHVVSIGGFVAFSERVLPLGFPGAKRVESAPSSDQGLTFAIPLEVELNQSSVD